AGRVGRNIAGPGTTTEEGPALRRKLGLVADHADPNTVDIRDFGTAQPKRVATAGLLLLERKGVTGCRSDRGREPGGEQHGRLNLCRENDKHSPPKPAHAKGGGDTGVLRKRRAQFPFENSKISPLSWLR